MRPKTGEPIDAAMLAIFADHVPSGIGNALGIHAGGNSLDKYDPHRPPGPDRMGALATSSSTPSMAVSHGAMRFFAEDGTLMATASQSVIVAPSRRSEIATG